MQPGDRKPLVIGGGMVALMLVALAVLNPAESDEARFPSSYSPGRRGAKAAFLLLLRSGYKVERWQRPPEELPKAPRGSVLVLAEPSRMPKRDELNALQGFAASGGTLLLAGDSAAHFAPQARVTYSRYRPAWTACSPAAPTRLTRGGPITLDGAAAWRRDDLSHLAHYEHEGDAVVVSYRLGKGEVIWWASALPLTNGSIAERGHLDLLVNSIGNAQQVLWDEYYHGQRSIWSHAANPALRWGLAQLIALAAVVLLTFARRSGPLLPLPATSRLAPLEFVETLGNLYHRAGASQAAVEIAFARFRQIAARRLGLHGRLSADEIARVVQLHGLPVPPDFAARLRRCQSAIPDPGLNDRAALELVRFLTDAGHALEPASAPAQEKPHGVHSPTAVPWPRRAEQGHRGAAGAH